MIRHDFLSLLPRELVYEIFVCIGARYATRLFCTCKGWQSLRESLFLMHARSLPYYAFNYSSMRMANTRMDMRLLIDDSKWKGVPYNKFKKVVLSFLASKRRETMIYECRNSYHRRLVHLFCDSLGLVHETFETNNRRYFYEECACTDSDSCCCESVMKSVPIKAIRISK